MAKKRLWSVVDDFDGSPAAETVVFALDGASYEIDLSAENALELRELLEPWINAGRRRGGQTARSANRRASTRASNGGSRRRGSDSTAVRAWAASDAGKKALKAANVKPPAAQGRIATAVVDAYKATK